MIELNNIYKTFYENKKEVRAVNGISIKVDKGDIYGIIGLSGAGKSTLVRCINLLEKPTSGEVIIDGTILNTLKNSELREHRKKIGMIFQNFNLLKSKTVYENVAFPLKICGLNNLQIKSKVDELLEIVELKEKAKFYPSQLSGGQKQRVGIARALANNPYILLCDEATSALDPKTTTQILNLLKKINKELGITIVVITHEMQVIKGICNKVSILENGNVIEEGSVIDVFSGSSTKNNSHFIDEIGEIKLNSKEKFIKLIFNDESASKPILSQIIRTQDIDFNIVFGKIEQIGDASIGRLIVSTDCSSEKFTQAIKMLEDSNVKVEVING